MAQMTKTQNDGPGADERISYKTIAEALFDNYESIYDVVLETGEYKTYFQSEDYQELSLAKKGNSFFTDLPAGVERLIHPDDRRHVIKMLSFDALRKGCEKGKRHTFIYRIDNSGREVFHQLTAIKRYAADGAHILMGIKNIDTLVRYRMAHEEQIEAMKQKEHNHIEAVLSSAAGFVEANLTDDRVMERSISNRADKNKQILEVPPGMYYESYDRMRQWITDHIVIDKKERYRRVSSREFLLGIFKKGENRSSVLYTAHSEGGRDMICREVFYLYKEKASGNIHVFSVIYDLTEQQRKEREREELENELQNSRIRNSTSQMQPHFLYNALGSIQEVILMDPKYASDLLGDFTVHLRSCVRAMASDDPIRFEEELKNIKAYVNIEKMRFGDKLSIEYDIGAADFDVLPLSIQPLVENAIRHGIYHRGREGGTVTLRTGKDRDGWVVQVEDNGVGFDVEQLTREIEERKRDSTGLYNIRFRLEKIMGARVELDSAVGRGTTVTIRIPGKEAG